MQEIFVRNVPGMTEKLQKAVIGIAGCGGLGSNIAVALTRAGVGKLILCDFDIVEASNLNRQHFFQSDIGKIKSEALAVHLKNINPVIELEVYTQKLTAETAVQIFGTTDILMEAFDRAESKKWLIESWCTHFPQKPVIAGSGLADYGKFDLLKIRKAGRIYLCGDESSDMSIGLCAPRVMIVAAMQANLAVEIIMDNFFSLFNMTS